MTSSIFILPIQPGKTEAWKAFVAETHGSRIAAHDASRRRVGVTHEVISLAHTPQGDFACIFREADDIDRVNDQLLTSSDPHDQWLRESVIELCGISHDNVKSLMTSGTVHADYRPGGS